MVFQVDFGEVQEMARQSNIRMYEVWKRIVVSETVIDYKVGK